VDQKNRLMLMLMVQELKKEELKNQQKPHQEGEPIFVRRPADHPEDPPENHLQEEDMRVIPKEGDIAVTRPPAGHPPEENPEEEDIRVDHRPGRHPPEESSRGLHLVVLLRCSAAPHA
jgi:hypothetical protein